MAMLNVHPAELIPTHPLTMSRRAYARFLEKVRDAGRICVAVKIVEFNGKKYLVDGHHRTRAARDLSLEAIPAERVELPYLGYRTIQDLFEGER